MNAQEDMLRRCDRCGAVAKVQVQVSANLELLFCQHHATQHGTALHYPTQPVAV